jgi:predicted AlkP superfamily pyrophosphatase or phosphodiesterase
VPVQGGQAVGANRFARDAGDSRAFRASPELDGTTLAFAGALRSELKRGERPSTDLLIIGAAATDYVGHTFGTQGAEMCLQLLSLDRDLGDFFSLLDRTGIDYMVTLTSDHGGLDLPERDRQNAASGALRVDPALAATAMGKAIGSRLGLSGPVLFGDGAFGDMYIDRGLPPAQRARVLAETLRSYRTHPQVAAAFSSAELSRAPNPSGPPDAWTLIDRARASFDPERSGDLVVMLKPLVTPIADPSRGYVATHGSPWDYDRRVPILFWRRGLTGFEQPRAVETVDIMPTLASILGVPVAPGSIDGRCLDLIEGPATSCR